MEKSKNMNRRGDIPTTILVIGTLAICLLAILSFYISDRATKDTLVSVDLPEKLSLEKEKILVYSEMGMSQEEIYKILNVKTGPQGKYIEVEKGNVRVQYLIPWED